jgi:hypothetical protein
MRIEYLEHGRLPCWRQQSETSCLLVLLHEGLARLLMMGVVMGGFDPHKCQRFASMLPLETVGFLSSVA